MRKSCRFVLVPALLLLLLSVCAQAADPITPEDLQTTQLTQAEFGRLCPGGQIWWPKFPEFNTGFNVAPGERFYVVQNFSRIDGGSQDYAESALVLANDEQSARISYTGLCRSSLKTAISSPDGPLVGDECRYFDGSYDGKTDRTTTVRYRVGSVVGKFTMHSGRGYMKPEEIARYAEPTVRKIRLVLAGTEKALPMSRSVERCMPPASAMDAVGPIRGTAMVPAEAWAAVDSMNNPPKVLDDLHKGGVTQVVLRRYKLNGEPDHVLEAVLFVFADSASADQWVNRFVRECKQHGDGLDKGNTGRMSAFTFNKDTGLYELMFAKGRIVGDVTGWAPFAETKPICEAPVRQLAEMWYASPAGERK